LGGPSKAYSAGWGCQGEAKRRYDDYGGYGYLMDGHKDAAKRQLTETLEQAPADKLSEQILKQL